MATGGATAWGTGPFDNDLAAHWAARLDDASVSGRVAMLRAALTVDDDDVPDPHGASVAVAAAAVVAAARTGVVPDAEHWPGFLLDDDVVLPDDLCALALTALSRVAARGGAPHGEWTEDGDGEEWAAQVAVLRTTLELG